MGLYSALLRQHLHGGEVPQVKTFLDCALELARLGFSVFPVAAGKKSPPLFKKFWERATTDEKILREMWNYDADMDSAADHNPAISTTKYQEQYLIVVDVDPKHGGDATLESLQVIEGYDFPVTFTQATPSGGRHLVYTAPVGCSVAAGGLGEGLDIRSHHNYILGAGAEIDAGTYTHNGKPVAPAPTWLVEFAYRHPPAESRVKGDTPPAVVDRRQALRKTLDYLNGLPPAPERQRDALCYVAACRLREFGLSQDDATEQMDLWWRRDGDFGQEEVAHAVASAYKYAQSPAGSAAPESYFTPVGEEPEPEKPKEEPKDTPEKESGTGESSGTPMHLINRNHAFVMVGNKARIMWEDIDHKGRPRLEFMSKEDFFLKHLGERMLSQDGKKMLSVAEQWLGWQHRRSYDGTVFAPGGAPPRFYNLWRGFAYKPLAKGEKPTEGMLESVGMFKTHVLVNYCNRDEKLAHWLLCFFAHMIQHPEEKPLTALVFRGGHGNGKSAGIDRVGALFPSHYFAASDQRYLLGNFNSYMRHLVLFVLEEAFWSGNEQAKSVVKELITRMDLPIEEKFREPYRADNFMRLVIIGNERWLIPASLKDERRWAVFDVAMRSHPFVTVDDKRRVRQWFHRMRKLMEAGGYRYLLTYLQQMDLTDFDANEAPFTQGLAEQKEMSLPPLYQWWLECLRDGRIVEGDFPEEWPHDPEKTRIREAFNRYCQQRAISGWRPSAISIGRDLRTVCPSLMTDKKKWVGEEQAWVYRLPPLEQCRKEWDSYIGSPTVWPGTDEDF